MIRHGIPRKNVKPEISVGGDVEEILKVKSMPDSVEKHENMVLLNPDDYNSWNYLKRKFLDSDEVSVIARQLELTQLALQANPKSYSTWFHRYQFFRKMRSVWFNEHRLCGLLLKLDPRNFHCWNYCLKNGFEIKVDLHNPTSMHFQPFKDEWLFIDPDDEGVWRAYEKRRTHQRGMVRKYPEEVEVLLEIPFSGTVMINGEAVQSDLPTRRITRRMACELRDIRIGGKAVQIVEDRLPSVVEKVLELSPECTHALKMKLEYCRDAGERREISELLQRVDPLRREYYKELARSAFRTYALI